jgi:serine/threonine-protein kinase
MTRIGKYELIEKIGQGAMGEVHRAHDTVLGRFVAIKTMSAGIGQNDDLRKRFHREAQSAARLNHPNIVTLYDFGEDQGKIFMAMELLEGSDLKDVIKLGGLSLDAKLDLREQICDGLAAAHAASVIHRDLKPPNIHVLPDCKVKIVDFGLARLGSTSDMTKTGMVMGTPNYMSPEQVRGERVDARSDVFSLGAVFYELLSNRKAFDADTLHTVLFQVLEHEPPSVRHWMPDLPEVLAPFIERALAKDPAFRYQDAREMRAALARARQALAGAEIQAQEPDLVALLENPNASAPAARQTWVQGSAALAPAPSIQGSSPPVGTLSGGSATQAVSALTGKRTALLAGGAVGLVALIVVAILLLRPRPQPAPSPSPVAAVETVTKQLILTKVQLAQSKLEAKDYKAAADEAKQVLELDAANTEAKSILSQAEGTMKELEDAAGEAREAVKAGDSDKASAALARVIKIDPQHPVIAELSSQLNSRFQGEADEAREAMKKSQAAAESAKSGSQQAFAEGMALARQADGLYKLKEFTGAAQKFLDARNKFERPRRDAQEQRVASLPKPGPTVAPRPGPAGSPAVGASVPAISLPPVPSPSAAPAGPSEADQSNVRQVIARYEKAIEEKDIAQFKRIMPTLSAGQEKALKDGFKLQSKGHDVRITIENVNFNGNEATVRLSRHDTVNGKPLETIQQSIVLVKSAGGWSIRSVGQ